MSEKTDDGTTKTTKATATFSAGDVVTVFDVTLEQAEAWLAGRAGRRIADRMCVVGWEALEMLGDMDGFPRAGEENND